MSSATLPSPAEFARLRRLDTCAVSNAIERTNVRLRNEGYVRNDAHCLLPRLDGPMLGYAVTGVVRSAAQPISGGWYYDRISWWEHFLTVPAPRVMILQDADDPPGFGAFVGAVHANIASALDCVGCVTNGVVRDLPDIEALGFHVFAAGLSPSHAYAHIVEWGRDVEIGGQRFSSGDLVHGDLHGVQTIPLSIASRVPAIVEELAAQEHQLFALCRSREFSLQTLSDTFERLRKSVLEPGSPRPGGQ